MSTSTDAKHVPLSTADKLAQDAAEAARVRSLANHPDVIALRVEKVRAQVDAAVWVGILLGLAFTMVNVQHFAAAGAAVWSLPWLAAWLLDPMVSVVLVAVLRAEQVTARYQVHTGRWAHRTKWFCFAATYVMNTWSAWSALDAAGIVLHSVPPTLVFCAAETAPVLRDRLTEAVLTAAGAAFTGTPGDTATNTAADVAEPAEHGTSALVAEDGQDTGPTEPAPAAPRSPSPPRRRQPARGRKTAGRRKLLADYVAEARAVWAPGIEITPAWVRSVTDCGRGTSKNVADALRSELAPSVTSTVQPAEHDTAAAGSADRQREVAA